VKTIIAALAAAGMSLFASDAFAQEQDLAAQFQSFCLATDGATQAVALAARGSGYVRPPDLIMRPLATSLDDIQHPSALWKVYDGGVFMVLTGQIGASSAAPLAGDACIVMALPTDTDPEPALRALLGVGDPMRQQSINFFIFEQRDGVRQAVRATDTAALRRAAASGRLRVAAAAQRSEDGANVALMMLITPRLGGANAQLAPERGAVTLASRR
jgi:hypothetical protein